MKTNKFAATILSIMLAACLAACASSYSDEKSEELTGGVGAPEEMEMDMASNESQRFSEGAAPNINSAKAESPELININQNQPNLKLIWYADVNLETLEFDNLVKNLNSTIDKMDGFVESSRQYGGVDAYGDVEERNLEFTVRIPSKNLDEFLTTVSTLGNVTSTSKRSENITLEYADNEARKNTLQTEYDKLMELLEQAEDLESIIALEARLSDVRYQLDGLSSQLRKYDNLVDYSTVNLNIYEVEIISEKPNDTIGTRISRGFENTFLDLKIMGEDLIVLTVVKSPFIILFIAVLFLAIKLISKFHRKSPYKIHKKLNKNDHSDTPTDENKSNNSQN